MANRLGVDLFISIHCDAFAKETAVGCGSYVMGPAKTEANLKMAQKENAAMLKETDYEKNYNGFNPYSPESYIELSLRQNAFLGQSLSFSDKVQKQFKQRVGRVDRGVKQAPFWVISFTTMPSVLIELGFLTNKSEEDFLQSSNGQELMASAIYRAFKEYKAEIEGLRYLDVDEIPAVVKEEESNEMEDNPSSDPSDFEESSEIYFAIQLASSSSPLETVPENFKGLKNVKQLSSDGLYKYIYGQEFAYKKAKDLLNEVEAHGYNGCFVIAIKGGERMDLGEAIRTVGK
jgi:N-acetylmuramoyl-L-alanine amidase